MAKKKKQSQQAGGSEVNGNGDSRNVPATQGSPSPNADTSLTSTVAKKGARANAPAPQPSSPALIICRNKHWRYISSFHGPWLQLPPEILESLANTNYNTARPRPIDPAVFFDLVKVRKLVDDATNLAVRAASGVASSSLSSMMNAPHPAAALGLGLGGGNQTKLSRERKYRMREQATQKLSKAYHLDEIACSVATMQSASSLEDVASLVLQRSPNDPDAKYVHFFHEKIPSRQLAESTSLTSLDEIIRDKPAEGEPLRTRATVRVFKEDYEGAAMDLSSALQIHRFHRPSHTAPKSSVQPSPTYELTQHRGGRRQEDVALKEDQQPSSLEIQLLFQRAGVYLTIACQHVNAVFLDIPPASPDETPADPSGQGNAAGATDGPEPSPAIKEARKRALEAQKLVRLNAKRALRDYTAYLSHFDYSPDLPIDIAEDFARKVNAANHIRVPYGNSRMSKLDSSMSADGAISVPHRVYALSDLFNASPPENLPEYPQPYTFTKTADDQFTLAPQTTTETLTYHPLLTDALHSLLLCHCLVQTSAKELQRHANMVARLARLADGYPVFQASRSPARADWIEVLRKGENWINLQGSWEALCAPAPLPLFQGHEPITCTPEQLASRSIANMVSEEKRRIAAGKLGTSGPKEITAGPDSGKEVAIAANAARQQRAIIMDALGDDRVRDEASFSMAIRARQARAERDYRLDNAVAALDAKLMRRELEGDADATSGTTTPKTSNGGSATPTDTEGGKNEVEETKANRASQQALKAPEDKVLETSETPSNSDSKPNAQPTSNTETAVAQVSKALTAPKPKSSVALSPSSSNGAGSNNAGTRRWAADDGREYPILTERAAAVARWVREASPNAGSSSDGTRKRKKKPTKKSGGSAPAGGAAERASHSPDPSVALAS